MQYNFFLSIFSFSFLLVAVEIVVDDDVVAVDAAVVVAAAAVVAVVAEAAVAVVAQPTAATLGPEETLGHPKKNFCDKKCFLLAFDFSSSEV